MVATSAIAGSGDLLAGRGRGRPDRGAHGLARLLGRRLIRRPVAVSARRARDSRTGIAGLLILGRGGRRARPVPAVRAVEARALEDDPYRGKDLPEPASAGGAHAERRIGELLHRLDRLATVGAGVLVCRHGPSFTQASRPARAQLRWL